MKGRRVGAIRWSLSSLAAAVLLVFGLSQTAHAQQGVSKDEILLGAFGALTGPIAFLGAGSRGGLQLAADQINEHGGIHGRKIKLIFEAGNSPSSFLAAAKKLVEQDKVFGIFIASGSTGAVGAGDYLREKGIPTYTLTTATPMIHVPLARNIFHGTVMHAKYFGQAVINQILSFEPKPKKVAVIVENLAFHKAVHKSLVGAIPKAGLELVADEEFDPGDRDFTSQILAVVRAKPDVVMVQGDGTESGFLIKQAPEKGLVGVHWVVGATSATDAFVSVVGQAGEGVKTTWALRHYHREAEKEMVKFEAAWHNKYKNMPPGRPNLYDLSGYNSMYIFALGLKQAGKNPAWESFITSMESLKDATPSTFGKWAANVSTPETFSATDHQGNDRLYELVFRNGTWVVDKDVVYVFPGANHMGGSK